MLQRARVSPVPRILSPPTCWDITPHARTASSKTPSSDHPHQQKHAVHSLKELLKRVIHTRPFFSVSLMKIMVKGRKTSPAFCIEVHPLPLEPAFVPTPLAAPCCHFTLPSEVLTQLSHPPMKCLPLLVSRASQTLLLTLGSSGLFTGFSSLP